MRYNTGGYNLFYYIKGNAVLKDINFTVIDVNGIGYKIYTSSESMSKINTDDTVCMYTHLYIRDDIMDIYGFYTKEELDVFLKLISINGVGPKAALSLLSVTTLEKFILAVLSGDVALLKKAQGIGAKTAQRVVLELKDKISSASGEYSVMAEDADSSESNVKNEAIQALIALGFSSDDAAKAVYKADDDLDVEGVIKFALKNMDR